MQISQPSRTEAPLVPWASALIVLSALVCIATMQVLLLPRVTAVDIPEALQSDHDPKDAIVRIVGAPFTKASLDLHVTDPGFLHAPAWYSALIVGAVDRVTVNGRDIEKKHNYSYSRIGSELKTSATNVVRVTMHLTDPLPLFMFGLQPSIWNPVVFGFFLLGAAVILLWHLHLRHSFRDSPTALLFLAGAVLRYLYAFTTPYYARAYDFQGHIDVVRYVGEHLSLPSTRLLWEAYQMPLYYVMVAPLYRVCTFFGLSLTEAGSVLRVPSFMLSVLTLLVGIRIAERVFPAERASQRIAAMLLAAFPWLVYLSSQITNDVLVTFVGFLWVAALYTAVTDSTLRHWIIVGIVCGIGILSKMSAAPWIPVSMLCAFLPLRRSSLMVRALHIAGVAVTSFFVGGWVYVLRKIVDPAFGLVANAFNQWGAPPLLLTTGGLLGFNLLRLIRLPFRQFDAGGFPDDHVFIEDLIRTAHFGSVSLSPEAAILFVLLVVPVIALIFGAIRELKHRHLEDVIIISGMLFATLLMRLKYPFPPSQHFRYVAVIALPCALLVTRGISVLGGSIPVRAFLHVSAGAYAIISAAIVFTIAITG